MSRLLKNIYLFKSRVEEVAESNTKQRKRSQVSGFYVNSEEYALHFMSSLGYSFGSVHSTTKVLFNVFGLAKNCSVIDL